MTVAEMIRANREKAGLTQDDLATKCKVSRQVVNMWENGRMYPANLERVFGLLFIPFVADLGMKLRIWRKTNRVTSKDVAGTLGVNPGTMLYWERKNEVPGKYYVDVLNVIKDMYAPKEQPRIISKPKYNIGDYLPVWHPEYQCYEWISIHSIHYDKEWTYFCPFSDESTDVGGYVKESEAFVDIRGTDVLELTEDIMNPSSDFPKFVTGNSTRDLVS